MSNLKINSLLHVISLSEVDKIIERWKLIDCPFVHDPGSMVLPVAAGDRIKLSEKYILAHQGGLWFDVKHVNTKSQHPFILLCSNDYGAGWFTPDMIVSWSKKEF